MVNKVGENPVLLVIDVQHDVMDADGPLTAAELSAQVIPKIRKVIAAARASGIPVIYTLEKHQANKVD